MVGGGFTGLWTALLAKERDPAAGRGPARGPTAGWAASGRNGGFCAASLTHGAGQRAGAVPAEMPCWTGSGGRTWTRSRHRAPARIDCDFERTGELSVATAAAPARRGCRRGRELARGFGRVAVLLDAERCGPRSHSPTYVGGLWDRDGCAMVDPARLAWGLAGPPDAAASGSTSTPRSARSAPGRPGLRLRTPHGSVRAARVALGTDAFPPLLRRLRRYLVPVYDYALVTEPLSAAQLARIGWRHRQGVGDIGNQFHYYRLTGDNRILWGGYDAVYYNGGLITADQDQRPATFARWPGTSSRPSRSSKGSVHPPWGGGSTPARGSACSSAPPTAGGSPTPPGTPGSASAPPGSAAVLLDLLGGQPTERTALGWCAASRCRSRPSRCAPR